MLQEAGFDGPVIRLREPGTREDGHDCAAVVTKPVQIQSLFAAIEHAPGAVLLDSGRPAAERGRYDLLSAWPLEHLAVLPDESGADFLQRLRIHLTQLGRAVLPASVQLPPGSGPRHLLFGADGTPLTCCSGEKSASR